MNHDELVKEISLRVCYITNDHPEAWIAYKGVAEGILSTILSILLEHTGEMKKVWDDDMSDWIDERIEDPYHPWVVMLKASPLNPEADK